MNLKTKTMNKIKFLKTKRIKLNGVQYKPYMIGELPSTFGLYTTKTKIKTESANGSITKD